MKRRSFISMLTGTAGALFVPQWRIPEPVIVLPPPKPRHVMYAMGYTVTEGEMEPQDNVYATSTVYRCDEGGRILTAEKFRQLVEPGIKQTWDKFYHNWEDHFA
jgi:hypothetical protein